MGRRSNQLAPYFVQVREFERRLMIGAIEIAGGDVGIAAMTLGVPIHYLRARSRLLGGVFEGEPKNEPPGSSVVAFNTTSPRESDGPGRRLPRKRKKPDA